MSSPARDEYPRPHFDRSHAWLPLNGSWEFVVDATASAQPAQLLRGDSPWPLRIQVPFAWETPASGVGLHWLQRGWYRRSIEIPESWRSQRVVLHFGAVHHTATVWVNGVDLGVHEGGYTPFEYDITEVLDAGRGSVVVRVDAPVDKRAIPHGKQRSVPADDYDGCSFTPSSGIWQPVWLEARPATYVEQVALRPAPALDAISAEITLAGPNVGGAEITLAVSGVPEWRAVASGRRFTVSVPIDEPRLWCPDDPYLYEVVVRVSSADGVDTVRTATGLRDVRLSDGQILLNGERLYVRGVLDQGYWPHTGITAPSDAAFAHDLELARAAGYNLVRKHLKLEDPRYLYHADRLGLLLWCEPASTGRFTAEAVAAFEAQIDAMVARDGNHPSIVIWGLYNEEWGLDWDVPGDPAKQDAVRRAVRMLKAADRTRPVVDNSGWAHVESDLVDWHIYDETPAGWQRKVRALLADGEDRFPVSIAVDKVVAKLLMAAGGSPPGDAPNLNSEYGGGYTSLDRGWNMRWQTQELRRYDELSGYVWTELYDIEHETAGIFTFDRQPKDSGGEPVDSNAQTMLIVDVDPVAPGCDIVIDGREVCVAVRLSHHGPTSCRAVLRTAWSPQLSGCDPDALAQLAARADDSDGVVAEAKPFVLGAPVRVAASLPEGVPAARLHLVAVCDGAVVARTCIDVVSQSAIV